MKIAYSCQVPLGTGFGLVAEKAVEAVKESRNGYLDQIFTPQRPRQPGIEDFDLYFDKYVSLQLGRCDAFIGWANAALECIKKAKSMGAKTFIHRGSAHILFQADILEREGVQLNTESINRQLSEYEEVDHIIVDSEFIRETFHSVEPELDKKVHVVNPGVDAEKFTYKEQRQDKFVVLFVGGNHIRKGLKYLLHAWGELHLDLENAELRIVGMNNQDVMDFYPLQWDKSINCLGYVEDPVKEYHNASLLCLPSIEDGWGMVVLEAMSCGKPVIISQNVGAKDAVYHGKNGLIVRPASWEDIFYKLKYVNDHRELLAPMGKEAREAAGKYTWEKYKKNFIEVIESCI